MCFLLVFVSDHVGNYHVIWFSSTGPGVTVLPAAPAHLLRRAEEEYALFLHRRLALKEGEREGRPHCSIPSKHSNLFTVQN